MENNYLIKTSNGEIRHFFYNNGSIFHKTKKDGHWGGTDLITADAKADFCVLNDGADNIHMVLQNCAGDVIYQSFHHEKWHSYTILKSKEDSPCQKNFRLILIRDRLCLLYTLMQGDRCALYHSFLGPDMSPSFVDYITESERPFFAVTDDYLNTYIYYTNEQHVLGYRIYRWSEKEMSRFYEIEKDCICPYVHISADMNHHISAKKDKSLCYFISDVNKSIVKTQIITPDTPDFTLPIILGNDKKLWMMYRYNGGVYYGFKDKDAKDWGRFLRFISSGAEPMLFNFQSDNIHCHLWGYIVNNEIQLFNTIDSKNVFSENKISKEKSPSAHGGDDAVNFADRHIGEFGRPPASAQAQAESLNYEKIKILLAAQEKQIDFLKKQIDRLYIKVEELEKRIKEFL